MDRAELTRISHRRLVDVAHVLAFECLVDYSSEAWKVPMKLLRR